MGMPGPCSRSCTSSPYAADGSNPDPSNFKVISERVIDKYLIVEVNYPDAKNFEGNKILVYRDQPSIAAVLKATGGKLDPHFSESGVCPIARFAPTPQGMSDAVTLAQTVAKFRKSLSSRGSNK